MIRVAAQAADRLLGASEIELATLVQGTRADENQFRGGVQMVRLWWGAAGALVLTLGLLAAVACTSTAPAQPSPVASTKPATESKPAAEPEWKAEWEKVLAAAKKEGKVVVAGPPGESFRKAADDFEKAYPEIKLSYQTGSATATVPKILAERGAGQYLWDVFIEGSTHVSQQLRPNKAILPLRTALILPEVLDDSKWHQGFDAGWLDSGKEFAYAFFGFLHHTALVNRDIAPESELKTIDDLLDPKWKGKIAWQDPRSPGPGQSPLRNLYNLKGEEWLRKLLAQDIVALADSRQMLEGLVRGRYAVAIGHRQAEYDEFRREGLTSRTAFLDSDSLAGGGLTSGSGTVALFDNAPNPNAAKVFINWLLSKEGQEAHVRETSSNSRRLDVPGPPETAPKPGIKYDHNQGEQFLGKVAKAVDIAKEMLR